MKVNTRAHNKERKENQLPKEENNLSRVAFDFMRPGREPETAY